MQSEPKMWRLLQVAKNLNVSIKTLADYLDSLGYIVQNNPNFQISDQQYELAIQYFSNNVQASTYRVVKEIHQTLFNFLYAEYLIKVDTFFFTVRKNDKLGKLSAGHWFTGNGENLFFSFWNGNDVINKTPNIYFSIATDGSTTLNLSALPNSSLKTDEEAVNKAKFLNGLAKVLNMKQTKRDGNLINHWQKSYQISPIENEPVYITSLKYFLQTDKVEIDKLVSFSEAMQPISLGVGNNKIGKLDKNTFHTDLEKILDYQNNRVEGRKIRRYGVEKHLILKNLRLTYIGHFENLELDLSKRVTILIGENGTGKSTILRAIVLALVGTNETKILNLQHPSLQNLLQMEGTMLSKISYAMQGKIELTYEYDNTSYINRIKLQHNEKNIAVDISEESFDTTINSFGVFEADEFRTLVMGFPQVQGGTNEKLNEWIPNHKDIKQSHTKDVINLLYNEPADWVDSLNSWIIDLYKGDAVKHRKGEAMQNQPIIDSVFEIISEVTSRKITFYDLINEDNPKSRVRVLIDSETTPIPLDLISQGYKNVFGWVAQLVKRVYDLTIIPKVMGKLTVIGKIELPIGGNKKDKTQNLEKDTKNKTKELFNDFATVFIDEIDTYLHPSWQTKILSVLVSRFPNIRWVVTTHSPLVVSGIPNDISNVYWIRGSYQPLNLKLYGNEIGVVLLKAFGLMHLRNNKIQEQLDNLFVFLETEQLKKAEILLNSLKTQVEEDPDILRAETVLFSLKS